MPIFEVQNEAGTFQIDAPDQNSALSALSSLPEGPSNSLAGSAKALGTGLAEGAIGLAGLPADAVDLGTRGIDYLAGTKTNDAVSGLKKLGSENIKKTVESKTGEFYKSQTGFEKVLHTTGEFGAAGLAGPGGIARRVATQVVAPGVASEVAGQLAEGTGYEPLVRIGAALTSAAGASKIASANAARSAVPAVPTAAENAAVKTAGYQSQAIKDLEMNPTYATKVSDQAQNNLRRQRFSEKDPDTAKVYNLLEDLKTPEFGYTHKIEDFDNTRRRLNEIAGQGGSGGNAAQQAIRTIDAATLRIPKSSVVAGDAAAASKDLFTARKAAAVEFRDAKISQVLEKAANTAAATHSGGNLENEIYKQVRTMLNEPKKHLRGWNQEEKDALRAVLPDYKSGALRRVGKVMGGGGGLGQLASGSAGAAMFGPLGMLALPAIGMAANKAGSALAESRLGNVSETLRARSPAYSKSAQQARQAIMNQSALAGLPRPQQLALQALLSNTAQLPNYSGSQVR